MKHWIKIAMVSVIALGGMGCLIAFFASRALSDDRLEEASEIAITEELAASMKAAGFPITVQRAFEASSYGGWHGDGTQATVYQFPTNEVPVLVDALKRKFTEFTWTESNAGSGQILDLRKLIPPELMPDRNSRLLAGRPADGNPTSEYLVDPSRGLLYTVTGRF